MRATFDLDDNPFDPVLPGVQRRIAGEPMPVDRYPCLIERLMCQNIAGVKQAEDAIRATLFGEDASTDPPVQRDMIVLIHGVRGSGRTTLANLVRGWLLGRAKRGGEIWVACDLPFDSYQPISRPDEAKASFADLRERLSKSFKDGAARVAVLIDNLPFSCFELVVSAFKTSADLHRVFIVTTDDEELMASDLDAYGPVIEGVRLTKLPAEEVRVFIDQRLGHFRLKRVTQVGTDPDFALFPFAVSAPRAAVGGDNGSKPLRNVQAWLRKQIEMRDRELVRRNAVDAATAALEDLRARMIP